jgi:uncharacterized repeat protein (TIGR03837 family)
VCWRLARQLAAEHAVAVTLWLDDWNALRTLLSAGSDTLSAGLGEIPECLIDGVRVRPWPLEDLATHWQKGSNTDIDVVIEAFACELPASFQLSLSQQLQPPLWFNLEYLSAEDWVRECHGLVSVNPLNAMEKIFFFPGFVEGTGGLLRERALLQQHDQWQSNAQQERQQTLSALGVANADLAGLSQSDSLLMSVFTYESEALAGWLNALQHHHSPVLCLIPEGRLLNSLVPGSRAGELLAQAGHALELRRSGDRAVLGNLVVQVIPFQTQDEYDHLLSLCDVNLVRGEDSFVRAQWAGKPLLWHIYPQQQDAHLNKLRAFLALYSAGTSAFAHQALHDFWLDWNTGADCSKSWKRFYQALPELERQSLKWREKILQTGDIASNLMNFYKNRL